MRGRKYEFNSGESLSGSAGDAADKALYKPSGESSADAWQEVGDGHSTEDGRDNIPLPEERAISLDTPRSTGGVRVNAEKATDTPRNRTRELWERLYASAKSQPGRRYGNLFDKEWQGRGPRAVLVRYADDMLILCPTAADARREYQHLQKVLRSQGLKLNASKSDVTPVREGFDFLGFSFRRGTYTRRGQLRETIIKVPCKKAEQSLRTQLKEVAKATRLGNSLHGTVRRYNAMLRGWVNYLRISNVRLAVEGLVHHACQQLRIHLRRRYSRKGSQYTRRWPDGIFHTTYGLHTVTEPLQRRRTNACV